MDVLCEISFLKAIESKKDVLMSKQMTKEARDLKKKVWEEVKHVLLIETGKEFTEAELLKKWSNITLDIYVDDIHLYNLGTLEKTAKLSFIRYAIIPQRAKHSHYFRQCLIA